MIKPKILCVDDNHEIRILFEELFIQEYTVKVACTGKEALDLIKHFIPQVAIIDMNLEDMKGTDLVRQFKNFNQDIKSIIVTGEENLPSKNEYLVIKKPFDIFELKKKAQELSKNYEI